MKAGERKSLALSVYYFELLWRYSQSTGFVQPF